MTREEACLYAFNTLQADLVEYGQRLTTNVNGTEVTLSSGGAQSRPWNSQQTRYDHIRPDNLVQFAEEYFNKLEKKADTDDFERPAHTWLYDKTAIGTYVNWELLVERYTSKVTGRDLYDLLNSTTIRDNDLNYYVNGLEPGEDNETATNANASIDKGNNILKKDLARSNQEGVGITGDGVLTEVFLDKDAKQITIVSVNTWLAKAAGDYNESKEYAPMVVYFSAPAKASSSVTTRTWNVDIEDVKAVADVKEDDFRLVKISYKNNLKGDVVVMTEPDIMENSTVTKFSQNSGSVGGGRVTKLTTSGTEYKRAQKAFYNDEILEEYNVSLLTDKTYNIFMDEYGFFIGVDLYEGTLNYVFITGFDRPTSNLSISTAKANGIFLDGTMQLMTVNVTDTDKNIDTARSRKVDNDNAGDYFVKWRDMVVTNGQDTIGIDGSYRYNRWFTYSQNADGVYTLTPATRMNAQKIDKSGTTIRTDNVYVTDNVMKSGTNPYAFAASPGVAADPMTDLAAYKYGRNWVARSYGNDDSVFITVSLDQVDTNNGPRAITEVDEVYTGVDNAEIEINNEINAQEAEIYSVYNRNGYIIGAIVIGEGKGSNATVAYVMSDAKSEEKKDDTYYWEFDAIVDGEIKTLTAKSKYTSIFEMLRRENAGHYDPVTATATKKGNNGSDGIVELRFDADGYVVNVKDVLEKNIYNFYGQRATGTAVNTTLKGETSHGNRSNGGDDSTIVSLSDVKAYRINVIQDDFTDSSVSPAVAAKKDSAPNELELAGRTLYVTSGRQDEGLVLTGDAKAVVTQRENNKGWVDTEFTSVSAALAHLADANVNRDGLQYAGEIVAVIDGRGAAKWVYFYNYTQLTTGNQGGNRVDQVNGYVQDIGNNWLTVRKAGATPPTQDEALNLIDEYLSKLGVVGEVTYVNATYKVEYVDHDNNPATPVVPQTVVDVPAHFEFPVTRTVNGRTYKTVYFWDPDAATGGASINVDGKPVVISSDTLEMSPTEVAAELGTAITGTMTAVRLSNGKTVYCANNDDLDTMLVGEETGTTVEGIEFGYVTVTINACIDASDDATAFYGNTGDDKSTHIKAETRQVKGGSTVNVAVILAQYKSETPEELSSTGYTVKVGFSGADAGESSPKAVELKKPVVPGSSVSVAIKTAKNDDLTVNSVDLTDTPAS